MKNNEVYEAYIKILQEELIPAMGCTEPIAIALAAAKAREILGEIADRVEVKVSGSIIKNVKSVVVPNTNCLKGIPAAVVAGIVAGNSEKKLEVISEVTQEQKQMISQMLNQIKIDIVHIEQGPVFDIILTEFKGDSYVTVRIVNSHTNIVYIEKNKEILLDIPYEVSQKKDNKKELLNMQDIWKFTNEVEIDSVREVLDQQIYYNSMIAEEGLLGDYGANIGRVLLKTYGNDVKTRAKAKAAAGSDARMNGCELPVVINSGSGNQGITCSVPVIEYAKELRVQKDVLYRALILSNLVAILEKRGIGVLSAFCGAVSAGAGAAAGIAYLSGGTYDEINHTIVNTLAIVSGIVCDGAKSSCAAKIASSIDAAILAFQMCRNGQTFHAGEGIVMDDIESTLAGVGKIGKNGMKETNNEIIQLMLAN